MKCLQHKTWVDDCKICQYDHTDYHMQNEDLCDAHEICPLCGPRLRERKRQEAEQRKREGIEKRKKTMAAKRKFKEYMRWVMVYLMCSIGCDTPILEAIFLTTPFDRLRDARLLNSA